MTDRALYNVKNEKSSRALLKEEETDQVAGDELSGMKAGEAKTADDGLVAAAAAAAHDDSSDNNGHDTAASKPKSDREAMREAMLRALRSDSGGEEELVGAEPEHIVLVDPFTGEHVDMHVFYEEKIAPRLGGCLPVIEDFLSLMFFLALFTGEF